jgi:hypothetical protein
MMLDMGAGHTEMGAVGEAVDERKLQVLSLVTAAFERWLVTGVMPELDGVSPAEWEMAERTLEGAA